MTLTNAVGVIDSGFRGEIHAPLINLGYEDVELEAGTRVCQLVIMPFVPCELVPVESLGETERRHRRVRLDRLRVMLIWLSSW